MWQIILDVVMTALRLDFYIGAVFGVVLFFYLWYQEVRTDPGRWPAFASDRDYVVLCGLCFIPVINIVVMAVAFFMVAMMWDMGPPPNQRRI